VRQPLGTINREWHEAHPMPERASLDERIAWHLEHAENCGCREMPKGIRDELKRRSIEPGERTGVSSR
jgi:hypothetical protein